MPTRLIRTLATDCSRREEAEWRYQHDPEPNYGVRSCSLAVAHRARKVWQLRCSLEIKSNGMLKSPGNDVETAGHMWVTRQRAPAAGGGRTLRKRGCYSTRALGPLDTILLDRFVAIDSKTRHVNTYARPMPYGRLWQPAFGVKDYYYYYYYWSPDRRPGMLLQHPDSFLWPAACRTVLCSPPQDDLAASNSPLLLTPYFSL